MESPESSPNGAKPAKGKPLLLLLFFTVFIDLLGFGLIIPVMPTYAQQFQASDFQVGLLIASYSFAQFLFTPFWGRLSDKVGRRPVLLISLLASCVGYIIWGFSTSLLTLFISRLVAGAGNANIAVAQAYVADVTTDETRSKGMGAIFAAFGVGFVLGPAMGGFLTSKALMNAVGLSYFAEHSLQLIGFVAAFFSIVDLVATYFLLPEPEKRSQAGEERYGIGTDFIVQTLQTKKLQTSLAIFFLSTFAFANMEATVVLLTTQKFHFGPVENSYLFTWIGVCICLIQGAHRSTKKYGEKKMINLGTALLTIGLLLTPLAPNVPTLYAVMAVLAVGSGVNTPCNQAMLSKLAPRECVGGVLGVGQSLSTLGRILGPALGGFLFGKYGQFSPYLVGGLAMVVAFMCSLVLPSLQSDATSQLELERQS
ncbi:MAG: MFS transporter [Cyanobacteria bacterium SZAS LIN-3]|nr:MFS transporter [Cyanobacteria bacterium SZAS LIN-3]